MPVNEPLNSFDQEFQIFDYSFGSVVFTAVASVIGQLFSSDQRKDPGETMTHIGHYTRCNADHVPISVAETKRRTTRISWTSAVCGLSESKFSLLAGVLVPEDNFIDFEDSESVAMPPGCPIKAKLALRAVGYEGIYHLPRCGSYQRLKRAHRWVCSEQDALAEGFRKALTCR